MQNIKPLIFLIAFSLIVGEQYPFSDFPMYGNFNPKTFYLLIENEKAEIIPLSKTCGMNYQSIKKIYKTKYKIEDRLKEVKNPSKKAGEKTLKQIDQICKKRNKKKNSKYSKHRTLNLYKITLKLEAYEIKRLKKLISSIKTQ